MVDEEKFFKFCPRCCSTEVKLTDSPGKVAYRELYVRCVKCGFEAKEFPEGQIGYIEELKKERVQK